MEVPDLPRFKKPSGFYERQAMTKELKVVFAEGCFDNFDGTPEELAELIADIKNMAQQGTLMDHSTRLSEEDEEEFLRLMAEKEKRQ